MTYVARASAYGQNWSPRLLPQFEFYGRSQREPPLEQRIRRAHDRDPTKHYIAVVMSDGDILQCLNTLLRHGLPLWAATKHKHAYAMSWTSPPIGYELEQTLMRRVYRSASENDEFVCGCRASGTSILQVPRKASEQFCQLHQYAMNNAICGGGVA
jgi:hypothetical protein